MLEHTLIGIAALLKTETSVWLPYVALAISIVSLAASISNNLRSAKRSMRPALAIIYDPEQGWVIRNTGNGAAFDVIVAQRVPNGEWTRPVRIPPVAKDGSIVLWWLDHVNDRGIGARYHDQEARWYTSVCGDDLTRIQDGNQLPNWPESKIGRHWAKDLRETHGTFLYVMSDFE